VAQATMKLKLPVRQNRYRGFWDLYKHGITASAATLFMQDPEAFDLTYCQGYSARSVPIALEFGSCVHDILETSYKRRKFPSDPEIIELVNDYQQRWNEAVPDPNPDQITQQELVYGLAKATLPAYMRRWDGDWTGKYRYGHPGVAVPKKWLALEEVFGIPYIYPDGVTVPLRGRIDGLFEDTNGYTRLFDTKTKTVFDADKASDLMAVDFQLKLYNYAARIKYGLIGPAALRGAQINVFRRSSLRQGKSSMGEYLARVRQDAMDRMDFYFTRLELTVAKAEIMAWKQHTLDPFMNIIRKWYDGDLTFWRESPNLETKYGLSAMFNGIAYGDVMGYYKRQSVFPELPEVV
jgi:hypothetical protein